jgi:hypothetical protein
VKGEPARRGLRDAARGSRPRARRRASPRRGRERVWALGDCAAVPNQATPAGSTRRPASTRCARRGGWRRTCRATSLRTATRCSARSRTLGATRASPK